MGTRRPYVLAIGIVGQTGNVPGIVLTAAPRTCHLAETGDGSQGRPVPVAGGGSATHVPLGAIYALQFTHGIGEGGYIVVRVGIVRFAEVLPG